VVLPLLSCLISLAIPLSFPVHFARKVSVFTPRTMNKVLLVVVAIEQQ